jgi:hypothetical protein
VLVVLSGCVSTTVQQVREADTGIAADESVVVLGRQHRNDQTENDFVQCVSNNMGSGRDKVGVMTEQEFVDALFPWFEPRIAPLNTGDLPELVSQPLLSEKLTATGVRYVIWIEGSTERVDSTGSMTCSIATTGFGCFGFLSWENDSSYEASIWDLRKGTTVGKISSDASGTSFIPAVVVPVPFIARVQSSACGSMAEQLKTFINNKT